MTSELERVINEFSREMQRYYPNWNTIIEVQKIPTEIFGERLKALRKKRGHTQEFMGERLGCSKQAINKIEKGKNKKIPVDKLDMCSELFSVSVAYLLGLEKDDGIHIDKSQYYFWEFPNSKLEYAKEKLIENPLLYPFESWGEPTEIMLNYITNALKNDYELIRIIHHILEVKETTKKDIKGVFKAIEKIL